MYDLAYDDTTKYIWKDNDIQLRLDSEVIGNLFVYARPDFQLIKPIGEE